MNIRAFIIKQIVKTCPYSFLVASISVIGWSISVDEGDMEDIVEGLIVGTDEFIKRHRPKKKKGGKK